MNDLIDKVMRHVSTVTQVVVCSIDQVMCHVNTVTQVVVCSSSTEEELVQLIDALKRNPHVRKVSFSNGKVHARTVCRQLPFLFRVNSVIEHVRLPESMTNDEFLEIVRSIYKNDATAVKTLDLNKCNIRRRYGGEIFCRLLTRNQTVTEIDLTGNIELGSDGEAAERLGQALRDQRCVLKKLNLTECNIGNEGVRILCNALQHNSVLEEFHIGSNGITFAGLQFVVSMLRVNTGIKILNLYRSIYLTSGIMGDLTAGRLIAEALETNTTLQQLNVGLCGLTETDLLAIYQALTRNNNTLLFLNVSANAENEGAVQNLASCLPGLLGLEELQFSFQKYMSTKVMQQVLDGLFANHNLLYVSASGLHVDRQRLWVVTKEYVTGRNRVAPLLTSGTEDSDTDTDARRPVPLGLWPHLLEWLGHRPLFSQAQASLIYHVACAQVNDIFACAGGKNMKRKKN